MRTLTALAALAAFVGSFSAASAADLSMKDYAPAPIWDGMYAGGHVGALWNDGANNSAKKRWCQYGKEIEVSIADTAQKDCTDWKDMKNVKFEQNDDDVTLIGGVQIGRNWQFGSRVLGVEADVSFADGLDYLASLRLRAGYARDNLLLYITGGVAFAGFNHEDVKISWDKHTYTLPDDGDDQRIGAVVGAGAEYKLRPNMSIGVEGLYYAFADTENAWKATKEFCYGWKEYSITQTDDNDLFVVRGRLNYHFADDHDSPLK